MPICINPRQSTRTRTRARARTHRPTGTHQPAGQALSVVLAGPAGHGTDGRGDGPPPLPVDVACFLPPSPAPHAATTARCRGTRGGTRGMVEALASLATWTHSWRGGGTRAVVATLMAQLISVWRRRRGAAVRRQTDEMAPRVVSVGPARRRPAGRRRDARNDAE